MAAVASLNNSSSTTTMTPAGGPPSPGSLEAAAAGLPKWLLAATTLRLQETPAHRHHQQQQNHYQSLDQPLDLSSKSNSNSNNNNNNVSGTDGSSSASSTPSCPSSSSTPSAELKNVPATVAINPLTSDLIASDMVNQLRDLLPNTSTFLPHPATLNVPMVNTNNRNMFKSRPGKQPSHLAGRKTYTEDELQKALRDIQSGKLGTRRAAVIYGIPRSTLRNKVYKLALERDSTGSGGTGVGAGVAMRDPSTVGDDPFNGQAAELLPMLADDDDDEDRETTSVEDECNTNRTTADGKDHHHHQQHHHHNSGHQLHPPPQHRGQQPRTPSSSYMTVEDLLRITAEQQQQVAATMPNAEALRMFLQHYTNNKLLQNRPETHYRGSGRDLPVDGRSPSSPPTATTKFPLPITADMWPAAALHPQHMRKYLSHLLFSSATSPVVGLASPLLQSSGSSPPPPPLPPQQHVSAAHHHQQEFLKDFAVKDLMRKILDEEQQQQLQQLQLRYGNKLVDARRWTSNGCSSSEPMDTGRSNDDSNPFNVILRIPSNKLVPGSKGGDYESAVSGRDVSSPGRANSARSDSSSPLSSSGGGKHPVNLKDVIAKSITHRFQSNPPLSPPIPAVESFARAYQQYQQQHYHQHQQQQQHHHHLQQQQPIGMSASFSSSNSVIRNHNNNNLQQDDCRKRVLTPTNKSSSSVITPSSASAGFHTGGSSSSSFNSASAAAAAAAAAAAGDKSTRPKRGKYRNYDRDSLVEAVRAVQRGKMSVHRAGSYYGVPHSTLEYKVKERHLMRPRKREPKNPPSSSSVSAAVDDHHSDRKKSSSDLSSSSSSDVRPAIKLPAHVQFPSAAQQQPSSLPTPNGLKMFDAAGGPVGPYQPSFPFWAPSPFHVPMEFQRNPVTFPPMSMMQRMQAESRLHHHQAAAVAAASIASLGKNAREVAENLYDGTDNGNFLDGIIRSSLDTGLKSAATMAAVQAATKNAIKGGGAGRDGVGSGGDDCSPEGSPRAAGPEDDGEDRPASPPSCQDSAAESEDEKSRLESPDGQEHRHRHRQHDDSEHETVADRTSTASPERAATETENDDDDIADAVV